jgi:hypothetical protein
MDRRKLKQKISELNNTLSSIVAKRAAFAIFIPESRLEMPQSSVYPYESFFSPWDKRVDRIAAPDLFDYSLVGQIR